MHHACAGDDCFLPKSLSSPPSAPGRTLTTGSFLRSSLRRIPSLSSTSRLEAEYTGKQSAVFRGCL